MSKPGPLSEQLLADAIVGVVCKCGRRNGQYDGASHTRGYPDCDVARRAARIVLQVIDDQFAANLAAERGESSA